VIFGFLALAIAAAAVIAYGVSLVSFALTRVSARWLDRLSPAAQARLALAQALLPAFALVALMTAAMAPAFGWIADHCHTGAGDLHHSHPHLCAEHQVIGWPAFSVVALAAFFSARLLAGASRVAYRVLLARSVRRRLERASTRDEAKDLCVLPMPEPQAFVVGIWAPSVYVTRGLLTPEHGEHLQAVLAHERAHVRRCDPLKRLLCQLGLAFQLPGIAAWLEERLGRAQEMAADAEAAQRMGSGDPVARALVHLSRARVPVPSSSLSFSGGDLESRVRRLLFPRREFDFPSPRAFLAAGLASVALIALSADAVHHGVEMLLGLIGG
jgi:Zn-dependent protease with chaperone function